MEVDSDDENTTTEPQVELAVGDPDGKLTPEQKTRLAAMIPEANAVIQGIEDRMSALSVAATARWQQYKVLHEIDENSAPVMGDEEYDDFLALAEDLAQHALFREVALFMGLPQEVVDNVLTQALAADFIASGPKAADLKKAAKPFVKRSQHAAPPPPDFLR